MDMALFGVALGMIQSAMVEEMEGSTARAEKAAAAIAQESRSHGRLYGRTQRGEVGSHTIVGWWPWRRTSRPSSPRV